jgi:hypothetical protein
MEVINDFIKQFDCHIFLINMAYPEFLSLFKGIFGCTIQEFRRVIETHNMTTMTTKEFVLNCKSHSPEVAVQYYCGTEKK